MGNTYSPPLFSLLSQLPCLWLPTATHQKKAAPGEQVAIVTTFTRATPQRVHLSYMLKPLRFHPNLRVCVLAHMSDSWQAAWEGAWGTASNPASFIRQIGWQKVYVLKPWQFIGRAVPRSNSWTTKELFYLSPSTNSSRLLKTMHKKQFVAQQQKCGNVTAQTFIFSNWTNFCPLLRDHMASSSSRSLPPQSQRSNLISLITGDPLLIHAICCSVSMQPRCSVYRGGYAVLIVCLSTRCCLTEQKGY